MHSKMNGIALDRIDPFWMNVLLVVLGIGLLVAGYTLYRFGIRAVGGYLGGLAGLGIWRLAEEFVLKGHLTSYREHIIGMVLAILLFAIVGMFLAIRFYMILVFLGTFLGGLYIVYSPDANYGRVLFQVIEKTRFFQILYQSTGEMAPAIVMLVLAAIVLLLHRHVIIILTSITGAYLISMHTSMSFLFPALIAIGLATQSAGRKRNWFSHRRAVESSEE